MSGEGYRAYMSTGYMCLYSCSVLCKIFFCTNIGLFSPFPSLGSLSLWTRLAAGMVGQGAGTPAGCH